MVPAHRGDTSAWACRRGRFRSARPRSRSACPDATPCCAPGAPVPSSVVSLPPATRASQPSSRLASLDGLRGIAALVVLLFHIALVSPALASVERAPDAHFDVLSVLAYSPIRLLWSGSEAVAVFFVLSGFVLTLPLRERAADWVEYYPRRLVRLYVPVWGSIVLALVWWLAVPRVTKAGDSWWIAEHHFPLSLRGVGGDATLLLGTTQANSVLWSLRWEVWFSLALPLYLLSFLRWHRFPVAKAAVLAALAEAGQLLELDWLEWLPVFGLGVVAAAEFDRIRPFIARLGRLRGTLALLVVLLFVDLHWTFMGAVPVAGAVALGALGLVLLFAAWGPTMTVGTFRPVAWLGRVSFSLYLVHEPIVVSTALLLGTRDPLIVAPIAIPGALVIAHLFHRFVETPAHRLSKAVGRRAVSVVRGRSSEPSTDQLDDGGVRRSTSNP